MEGGAAAKRRRQKEAKKAALASAPSPSPSQQAAGRARALAAMAAREQSFWTKAMTPNGGWTKETFPEFPDAVFWLRQATAVACGLAWGVLGIEGFFGLVGFAFAVFGNGYIYYSKFAKVHEEAFAENPNAPTIFTTSLISEGIAPAFALFLVTWTMAYTFTFKAGLGPVQIVEDVVAAAAAARGGMMAGGGGSEADFGAGGGEAEMATGDDPMAQAAAEPTEPAIVDMDDDGF